MSNSPAEDADRSLRLCHRAEPAQLGVIRRLVRVWAQRAGVPDDTLVDLQLALGEAVANGVEHAYRATVPGTVDVDLAIRRTPTGTVVVAVRVADRGRWWPAVVRNDARGRGLRMIEQLAERVEVSATAGGTQVCFEIPVMV